MQGSTATYVNQHAMPMTETFHDPATKKLRNARNGGFRDYSSPDLLRGKKEKFRREKGQKKIEETTYTVAVVVGLSPPATTASKQVSCWWR